MGSFGDLTNHQHETENKKSATDVVKNNQFIDSRHFKKILLKSMIFPILLTTLLSLSFIYQSYKIAESNLKVRRADEFLNLSTESLKLIVDSETGLRGYILTGGKSYLGPWNNALTNFFPLFDRLKNLQKENSEQTKRLERISYLYDEWLKDAKYNIQLRTLKGSDNLSSYKLRKSLMDEIRLTFDSVTKAELLRRDQLWKETEDVARTSLIFTIVFGLGLGGVIAFFLINQLKKISQNYAEVLNSLSTATTHLEETVNLRTKDLITVNKELEAFSYSVSHDLRAPLRGIDGFSQILVDEYSEKLDGEAKRYLTFIRQGVQKMGLLIDDLINLSRLSRSEMKMENVNLKDMAQEIIDELANADPNRKFEFTNLNSAEVVQGDPGLLKAALQNLISNAWKYSNKKEISKIEFGTKIEKDKNVYFIKDNGVGFDMRYYDKLFQPFQRLHPKESFQGTGIGLATVYRIIKRHGGTIWAESSPSYGSTFYFTLQE